MATLETTFAGLKLRNPLCSPHYRQQLRTDGQRRQESETIRGRCRCHCAKITL